jgi:CRP-like cAMP-binding protein
LSDPDPDVADAAMESVQAAGLSEFLYVPRLVSLLRHRRLKSGARRVLVGYGEPVLDALAHFLADPDEDVWVRRHLPATIALIPCQRAVDILVDRLDDPDGFLRYKVVAALERLRREQSGMERLRREQSGMERLRRDQSGMERLRREQPALVFRREPIEALGLAEGRRYFTYLSLHHNLFHRAGLSRDSLLARALDEKIRRTLDRVYRLLGLMYPWKDVAAARWALEHGDARARAGASEYLDNILTGASRKRLMPVVEDMPLDERVRRGNVYIKSRPRDVEETLLQLINDDDPVVAACAIDLVRQKALWALGDDMEHVLAHRDARDWYVFEAASWALAERRMPAERRRELWLEPLPAVELADRLRRLPLFASVWVDELFRMAGAGRQTRHDVGRTLVYEGMVPDAMHVLLDGRVAAAPHGGAAREIAPPAAIGFEEVLQGRAAIEAVRTAEVSVTLSLPADDLRTLLADNTDLVRGLFATVGASPGAARPVVKGAPGRDLTRLASGGASTAVERALALAEVPLFARIAAEEMLHLAAIARETALQPGAALFGEAEPPFICVVLSGEMSVESKGGAEPPAVAGPGDTIGVFETLAGANGRRTAHAVRAGRVLCVDGEELFDLLGQRPELLRQLSNGLFAVAGEASSV